MKKSKLIIACAIAIVAAGFAVSEQAYGSMRLKNAGKAESSADGSQCLYSDQTLTGAPTKSNKRDPELQLREMFYSPETYLSSSSSESLSSSSAAISSSSSSESFSSSSSASSWSSPSERMSSHSTSGLANHYGEEADWTSPETRRPRANKHSASRPSGLSRDRRTSGDRHNQAPVKLYVTNQLVMPTLAELMQTRTAASMGAETSRITGDDVSTLNADPTKSLAPVSSWSSPAREEQNSSDETTGVRSYHGVPLYPPELVDQTGSHRIQDSLDHYTEWEPKLVEQIDHIIACLEWAPLAVRMRLLLLRKHTDEAKFERYKTEKSRSPLELRDHLPHVYITIDASPSQDVWKFTNDSGLDLLRVLGLLDTQPVGPPRGTITGCAYSITPAFAYLGGTRNHLAHGYGNCVDQLGNMWRGAFMNGKPYGRGILIRDGLCVYAGSLL